jgi:hypothetical protein
MRNLIDGCMEGIGRRDVPDLAATLITGAALPRIGSVLRDRMNMPPTAPLCGVSGSAGMSLAPRKGVVSARTLRFLHARSWHLAPRALVS